MAKKEVSVELKPINISTISLKVVGDSPLLVHNWSDKNKKEMRDKHEGGAAKKRAKRNPKKEYEDSLYRLPNGGGYGFPSIGFKGAAITAISQVDGLTKVQSRGAFHVTGDLVKITGRPKMVEHNVNVGMGRADLRYRGQFDKWSAVLDVRYNADVITPERLVNLFNLAGFAVGVGEWRPEKDGQMGMFHVEAK